MKHIYYIKQKPNSQKRFPVFLFLALLFIIVCFYPKNSAPKPTSGDVLGKQDVYSGENISPYPTSPPSPMPDSVIDPSAPLGQAVNDALTETYGNYGIVILNLKTGENYSLNQHVSYNSASLYKLWVMAEAYRQIRDGLLKEDEILSEKYETLNADFNIDPKTAEFNTGTISLSVKDAINKMITISDNYAALLLTLKIRLTNVAFFLRANGFNESATGTNIDNPTTTAFDVAYFFEKLYKKQLINEEYSNKILDLLKAQKLNDKIPKYLPYNVFIAHKTGELNEYTHDAGIVYMPNGDYIIVVLSKSDNTDLAKERISNVSESVYNYFTGNRQEKDLLSP
jgi:beta-lactamase class A